MTRVVHVVEILPNGDKDSLIIQIQYRHCWAPADAMSKDIYRHNIDQALSEYADFSTRAPFY